MKRVASLALAASIAWAPAYSASVLEDFGRIFTDAVNVIGQAFENIRKSLQAETLGPPLAAAIRQSRNDAASGALPMPENIKSALVQRCTTSPLVCYDSALLSRVRYKVTDPGLLNVATLGIGFGDAGAVTLDDIIVFANGNDALNNVAMWAHEMKHAQQYASWGVEEFARSYMAKWGNVEDPAYAVQFAIENPQGARRPHPDYYIQYVFCNRQFYNMIWAHDTNMYSMPANGNANIPANEAPAIGYLDWDGKCNQAEWDRSRRAFKITAAPAGVANGPVHWEEELHYLASDGTKWGAKRQGNGFFHTPY